VSRKVGGAVHRNRIKRWVREAYRTQPSLFTRPIDIVVIAKRGIEDFSLPTIRDDLAKVVAHYHEEVSSGRGGRQRGRKRSRRHRSSRPGPRVADKDDPAGV